MNQTQVTNVLFKGYVSKVGEHIRSLELERDALTSVLLHLDNISLDTMNVLKEANVLIDSLSSALVMAVKTAEQVQVCAT
jgi:hypothetical protein